MEPEQFKRDDGWIPQFAWICKIGLRMLINTTFFFDLVVMNYEVAIHQFQDSRVGVTYGFLLHLHQQRRTLAIDAGRARPLLDLLTEKGWTLDELWITHHDFDHTDGLLEVKSATGCLVTGPERQASPIVGLDRQVAEGDELSFAGQKATIIHAPGPH